MGVVGSLVALAGPGALVAAQTGTPTFFVTHVDAKAFPQVTFTLRAVNESNQAVAGLNNTLAVYENGQPVPAPNLQVMAHDDGPILYLFVVDQGRNTNYGAFGLDNVRQVFSTLVDGGYFVDGRDTVEVAVRQNVNSDRTEIRLPATQSKDQFLNWVATYPFERPSNAATRGLEGVGDTLAEAAKLVNPPGVNTVAMIFLTRRIEDPVNAVAVQAAEKWASEAKAKYVSVYTFQIENSQTSRQPLDTLAQGSNGQYVTLTRNNVPTLVGAVYQTINAQRAYYTVTYTSALNTTGPRVITVDSAQPPQAGAVGSYQVGLQPPTVSIEAPAVAARLNRVQQAGAYPPLNVGVTATVNWADGYPRAVRTAQLFVNGVLKGNTEPPAGADKLEFTVDLSDITAVGSTPVAIEVKVIDALGLEGAAQVNLTVEVAPPPTLIPTPVPTPASTASTTTVGLLVGGLVVCGLGLLAVVAVAAFVFLRRRTATQPSAALAPPVEPKETIIVGRSRPARAMLIVLEGPPNRMNESIPLVKPATVLGRNPQASDITFYAEGESSISRVHCAVVQAADQTFKLIDRGSTSGTFLNGKPIPPDAPATLANGDEIVLGDLAKRGVKVRFSLTEDAVREAAGDRTRIVKRSDPPASQ